MWAARRRTIILLIILAFFGFVVVLPYWYFHRVPPTCFDGIQNQDEQGVDCGGLSCSLVCQGGASDIKILWTKVFGVREGMYDLVAYAENGNFTIGAPKVPYVARLFDAGGAVIAERNGETFASPNERFAIFAGNMLTGDKVPVKGSIEVSPSFNWYTAKKDEEIFTVDQKVLTGVDTKPKLTAVLTNNRPETYRNIEVTVVIYDAHGTPIAVSSTKVEKLDPNSNEKMYFTWPLPINYIAETEECDTIVDAVLALDRSGSMKGDSENPPQPLTQAKLAAEGFVHQLGKNSQVGFVTFASDASNPMDQVLTLDMDRVARAIARTAIGTEGLQYTNIGDAIARAIGEFRSFRRNDEALPVIVLLTDGIPNRPLDPKDPKNKAYGADFGRKMADDAKKQNIIIYTIGLGTDVDVQYLTELASTPQNFYRANTGAELASVYKQISTAICKKAPSVIEIIPRVNNVTPAL